MNFPEWDRELFVFLNSKSLPWLDPVMVFLSSYISWILVCLIIMGVMYYRDKVRGKQGAIFLAGGLVATLIINNLIKLIIMRPRPGNELSLQSFINQLEEVGNSYSFFSAHSSSSFCIAMFSALYFHNKLYSIVIFAWAMAVAYSRIYVGKHYPLDVIVGILFGLLMGWFAYWAYNKHKVVRRG